MIARQVPILAVGALAFFGAACSPSRPAGWLFNETPSVPRGLYRLTDERVQVGDIVALRPPAAARSYLATLGAPPDARLLKRIVAGEGDAACRRGQRLTWPKGTADALVEDRRGRVLPRWSGCRRLRHDERLVLGDTPLSLDSRYFGPVKAADIDGVYEEVWRW